jgi:hypothetical protein
MRPPNGLARTLVPDFVVPFTKPNGYAGRPLFYAADSRTVECTVDLLASIVLTLARYEEVMTPARDAHGRFTAAASTALRESFLTRPIVDEHGLAFEQALICLVPGWQPSERRLRVKLSHDTDDVGGFCCLNAGLKGTRLRSPVRVLWMAVPFNGRYAVQTVTQRRDPVGLLTHLWGCVVGKVPSCLDLLGKVVAMSRERNLDSAVYWKAGPLNRYDSGYDPRRPKLQKVIHGLLAQGVEMGVHPGYETFMAPEKLAAEVGILREALGEHALGGRQHYLRWRPETWLHWEHCGLAYDSTLSFADHYGFRAGTCLPYRPWLLAHNRESRLLEIPLVIMDGTLTAMGLSEEQGFQAVKDCSERCRLVGGVFTFLCHNSSFLNPGYSEFYKKALNLLAGNARFDWKAPGPELW